MDVSASTIGDYVIVRALGKGTFGTVSEVYKYTDIQKRCALKKIDLKKCDRKDQQHAEEEAVTLRKCRHENLVSYVDSFQTNEGGQFFCLVMELCENGSLHEYIKKLKKGMSETECLGFLLQICTGLKYLHDRDIIHRDVKTSNIFLNKHNVVKIGDFGLARLVDSGSKSSVLTVAVGTPYYMSPEMINGQQYDMRTDIWSLACCIYEMETTKYAFNHATMQSLRAGISSGQSPCLKYSQEFQNLVSKMFSQEPSTRPKVEEIIEFIQSRSSSSDDGNASPVATFSRQRTAAVARSQSVSHLNDSKSDIPLRHSMRESPRSTIMGTGGSYDMESDSSSVPGTPRSLSHSRRRRRDSSKSSADEGYTTSSKDQPSGPHTINLPDQPRRPHTISLPVLLNANQQRHLRGSHNIERELKKALGCNNVKKIIEAVNTTEDKQSFEVAIQSVLQDTGIQPDDPDIVNLYLLRTSLPMKLGSLLKTTVKDQPSGPHTISLLEPLLLLYAELKDKLRRDQCRVIAKDIAAVRPLPAEEKASFQEMTKRRDLVDWLLKYVLSQKDEMILKIFCESVGKQSPSLGQTLQKTSVQRHELVKTERQPTTLQLDDLHFLQRSFNSKLVVDIIIDKLLSRLLITVDEHSSIRSSSDESEMTKRLEALLQYDTEITQQFKLITQPFRNASVSQTADWLVPLHAQAKETLSCGKGLAIATDIFQQIPGIISRTDFYKLFKLKDSSRDVIDRLLKHIYRQPRPEVFDVICYSLKEHDEGLYEHFLRMFFFKGADKERSRPVVNTDNALPSGRGTDYLYNIIRNRQTLDVVIDHLLSSFCITVDQHSDIRNDDSINMSIKKLVELLEQSPQTIVAVNAILRHLDKIADTKNTGDKEITITVDFGDLEVNSQTKNYMDSLCGQTLSLPDIGQFYLNDVKDGSVMIKISPLDRESLSRFRDMVTNGTILEYLRDHIKVFLPDDVEIDLSELSIGVIERTTSVPVQSASIINATIDILSVDVYKMENEPFVQPSFLHQKYSKFIGSIRMFPEELLSQNTESNSSDRGLVCAGQLGSNGEPLAIKQMLLGSYSESLETYKTAKERLQHRNIVKIFCVEKDEKYGYVAMERMDENLVEYVARSCQHGHADMNTEEEIYYMKRIVTGLAFIHEKGCLHNMLSPRAILLKKNSPDTLPKQVSIACFSYAALREHVPVSCKKGANDVLALIKVLLFVLYKKEEIVNGVIQADNRIIQSGHFDIFILLQDMLDSRTSDELKLQEFALHPALSSPIVQLDFLKESDRLRKQLRVDFNLTNRMNRMKPWLYEPTLTSIVYQYLKDEPHCKCNPHSLNSLVRCIRNCHEHLSDIMLQVQQEIGPEERYIYYWLVKYPGLVSSIYEAMRPHKSHTALRKFFIID